MNCHDAEKLIFAKGDGALDDSRRSALDAHLLECGACRQASAALAEVGEALRASAAQARVPDSEREWWEIRRRLRARNAAVAEHSFLPRRAGWAVGAFAAGALAVGVFFFGDRWTGDQASGVSLSVVASAESVDFHDGAATPFVFVDDETGWLVVWSVAGGSTTGS